MKSSENPPVSASNNEESPAPRSTNASRTAAASKPKKRSDASPLATFLKRDSEDDNESDVPPPVFDTPDLSDISAVPANPVVSDIPTASANSGVLRHKRLPKKAAVPSVPPRLERSPHVETPESEYGGDQTTHVLKTEELTVEGYSRAAVQTFWRIPELKLGFDLGWQPWEYMGTPRWFISHTHMDHLLALPAYVARRRMMKMPPPVVYLPEEKVTEARQLLGIFSRLDQGKLPCHFVGVADGDEIELSRELIVTVSKTFHTLPSVGYVVWERRKKLKPEFLDLPGEAIRDLKLGGTEITYEVRIPRVAYLGDSTAQGLDHNPDMFKAEILITEMTFVAPDHRREAIKKFGHLHLDDFVDRLDRFENKFVIAAHFSTRYNDHQIIAQVRRRIPDMMGGRLKLWF